MKIDFNKPAKDLDGDEMENTHLGKLIAKALVNQSKGDPLKYFDWAVKLHKGEVIDLDKADQKTLRAFIETNESITILAKYQILEEMDNQST